MLFQKSKVVKTLASGHEVWLITFTGQCNGNAQEVKEKWLSLAHHVHDKHTGHGKIYKKCSHKKIKRKWIKRSE